MNLGLGKGTKAGLRGLQMGMMEGWQIDGDCEGKKARACRTIL